VLCGQIIKNPVLIRIRLIIVESLTLEDTL